MVANRKRIPSVAKLPVSVTAKDLEDIRACIMVGEEFSRHAVVEGKRLRLDLSLDEIDDIQGHVAAEANHTRDGQETTTARQVVREVSKVP